MKYILNEQAEGIDYATYAAYLETIRHALPDHLYCFAADPRHFDLSAPASLHDAWLESLMVRETASGSRNELRRLAVEICLLGPYHDRRIHLTYTGVERYIFDTPARPGEPRYTHTAHGDLQTHEIRLGDGDLFVHELLFERGSSLLIEFAGFSHREVMLT